MSFQTRNTFVHLWNTNEDMFDEIRELSDPPIDSKATDTFEAQKDSKEIIKIVHVTSVVQPNVMKLREQVLCAKKKKNDSLLSLCTKSILVAS